MRSLACALVLAVALAPISEPAWAVSASRLARILRALSDSDLRVRIQALVALGRLKDRRSVPRLIMVLRNDPNDTARSLAAAALGAIGDSRAAPALRMKLADRSSSVRRQARIALAGLSLPRTPAAMIRRPYVRIPKRRAPRVLVKLGSMGAKTHRARRLRKLMRGLWRDQVVSTAEVGLVEEGKGPPRLGGKQKIYGVSSSITKLKRVRAGRHVKTTCTVSVMVDHGGSIVMMTSGGATVEVTTRRFSRSDAQKLERSALENAIASAHQNVMRYLSRQ